ncbi:head completion/stabilization protein [Lonepinella koalarum]|uniref:head completion/stabilization protein n=1 Tax=Lonepinella koalarum TaxID=53417 RepID=UPI003F6E0E5C
MTDGMISIKLAQNYEMSQLQNAVDNLEQEQDLIRNDGYFPDISISQYRNQARLDGTITTPRLKDALIEAMASVNGELATIVTHPQDNVIATLADMPSPQINGISLLILRYQRAVHCLATANLYERYASYDTTADGEKKMALLQDSIHQLRRDARFAIADILGKNRLNVELL